MGDFFNRIRDWGRDFMSHHSSKERAPWWLALISFAESSFFPVPPDLFLSAILISQKGAHWLRLAVITTLASVAGGLFGYLIGYFFFNFVGVPLISFYHAEPAFREVEQLFSGNAFLAIFLAAFTPIPYKVFTIAAGFFKINLPVFIIASLIGRGLRFFVVAYLFKTFGEGIGNLLYRYFNIVAIIFSVFLVGFAIYVF
jgi:membrane protein YqaA with SNARE-associated domain